MTNLIYFEIPILLLLPLALAIVSVICVLTSKSTVVSYIGAVLHAVAIAVCIFLGGNLTDIFFMLIISLTASVIAEAVIKKATKEEKR